MMMRMKEAVDSFEAAASGRQEWYQIGRVIVEQARLPILILSP